MSNEILDATLLPYQAENFLLPTIALVEIVSQQTPVNVPEFVTWRDFTIPLVTITMKPCDKALIHPKMAVLNALFSKNSGYPSYFGVLLEGNPRRIKLSEEMLDWTDETQIKANLSIANESSEVILVDLASLSLDVEKWLASKASQIAK